MLSLSFNNNISGECHSLQFIPHARVPILKLRSNRQGISCDISIDNLLGQMKSKLLFWISMMDDRFHDMVLLVLCCGIVMDFVR